MILFCRRTATKHVVPPVSQLFVLYHHEWFSGQSGSSGNVCLTEVGGDISWCLLQLFALATWTRSMCDLKCLVEFTDGEIVINKL